MNGITLRICMASLGATAVCSVIGVIILAALRVEVPGGLWAIGSSAISALAAFMVPIQSKGTDYGGQPQTGARH